MARGRIATPDEDEEEHGQDQEQEPDGESSRKRRRTNKSQSKASSAGGTNGNTAGGNADESAGEELTDEEDAVRAALRGWTVDSFTDKPVQATKGVLQQLKKMQEQLQGQIALMARSISRITDVAAALEDCRGGLSTKSTSAAKGNGKSKGKASAGSDNDDDDAEEGGEDHEDKLAPVRDDAEEKRNEETAVSLEEKVKSIIDEIKVLECRIKAVGEISTQLQQDQQTVNVPGEFKRRFEQELGDYREASDRTKYKNSKYYQEFKQAVWDIRHEDACPPISTFLKKGPDDPESDDDDIEIGGTTQDFKCPLTLLPFKDAVSSTKCVHSFSAEAIRNHIKSHRSKSTKCPVAGCDKMLSLGDIKPNPTLQRKSDQVKARLQRRREEEEDADAEDAELIE